MTCPAILFAVQQRNLDVWVCLYIPCSLSFLRFHEQHTPPSLTFTHGQIVSALVQAGADPALPLQLGWGYLAEATPLIVALMDNDPAATNILLHASSEVTKLLSVGPWGCVLTSSPLSAMLAAPYVMKNLSDLETALDKGADPMWGHTFGPIGMVSVAPLYLAASSGNVQAVEILLGNGANPKVGISVFGLIDLRTPLEAAKDSWTEKHFVAQSRNKNIRSLLEKAIVKWDSAHRSDL
eukprot:m.180851 g.180851  ORF g.180851 m.180851 type:complete len:238 (+) comp14953_c0_seq4:2791-3504(+)